MQLMIDRVPRYEMLTYTYRYYNSDSEAKFGAWLAAMDWTPIDKAATSNEKTNIYQGEVNDALERLFPLITVMRRSSDPPWYNWKIRKRIKQKTIGAKGALSSGGDSRRSLRT